MQVRKRKCYTYCNSQLKAKNRKRSDTDARKPHTKKLLSESGRQIPEASCNVRRGFWLLSRFPEGHPFPQTQPGELKIRPPHYSAQPFQ